jgi:hypothetical protein
MENYVPKYQVGSIIKFDNEEYSVQKVFLQKKDGNYLYDMLKREPVQLNEVAYSLLKKEDATHTEYIISEAFLLYKSVELIFSPYSEDSIKSLDIAPVGDFSAPFMI